MSDTKHIDDMEDSDRIEFDDDLPFEYLTQDEADQVRERVREMYESGVRTFTKEAIRSLADQIEVIKVSGEPAEITATGIDGQTVSLGTFKYPLDDLQEAYRAGGVACSSHGFFEEEEGVKLFAVPRISYHTAAGLLAPGPWVRPEHVYLPLTISYYLRRRDAETGKTLPLQLKLLPYQEILESFQRSRASWKASKQCNKLKTILESQATAIPPVNKIIGIACSTLDKDGGFYSPSAWQHSMLLTLRDFFISRNKSHDQGEEAVECLLQDPLYEDADRRIFEGEEGMRIIEDPQCFLEVDDKSVVISAYPDIPVRDIISEIARPAMLIWNDSGDKPGQLEGQAQWADPNLPRLAEMLSKEYTKFDFSAEEDKSHELGELAIYIRNALGNENSRVRH